MTVAYIADGINPNNAGFIRKNGKSSIIDYKDFYGDGLNAVTSGAEAFGDASAVSAQGNVVYDVADYANPSVVSFPGGHCYIRIVGVAPGANVVALKAGSELLPNSAILQAIDYAVTTDHVNVINESFGSNVYPDSGARQTIQLFNDNAVKAGVTVTESTGDAGVTGTIGANSTDPLVISAGASTDSRIYAQTGYALADRVRQRLVAGQQHLLVVLGRDHPGPVARSMSRHPVRPTGPCATTAASSSAARRSATRTTRWPTSRPSAAPASPRR